MDYEKKYKAALERAKQSMKDGGISQNTIDYLQNIFPELKESGDEKGMDLIEEEMTPFQKEVFCIVDLTQEEEKGLSNICNKLLSLAAQELEQKPVATPKFRVGDKVKKGYLTYMVEDIDGDSYKLQAYSKDGDKGCTVFLTIGYEKDYELVEQKPAWSEEDELMLTSIIQTLKLTNGAAQMKIDWLKSLKDRVHPQSKQEWSEEDERLFQIVIDILDKENHLGNISHTDLIACVRKLKSLRPHNTWKPSEEQMNALSVAVKHGQTDDPDALKKLLEQLKAL